MGDDTEVTLNEIDKRLSQVESATREANQMPREVLTEQRTDIEAQTDEITGLRRSVASIETYLRKVERRIEQLEEETGVD